MTSRKADADGDAAGDAHADATPDPPAAPPAVDPEDWASSGGDEEQYLRERPPHWA